MSFEIENPQGLLLSETEFLSEAIDFVKSSEMFTGTIEDINNYTIHSFRLGEYLGTNDFDEVEVRKVPYIERKMV